MERKDGIDESGDSYECKATRLPWGDTNVKINVGLSTKQFNKCKKGEIARVNDISEWTTVPPSTVVRNAEEGLTLLTSDHWHSKRTRGHSLFNHNGVSVNDLSIFLQRLHWVVLLTPVLSLFTLILTPRSLAFWINLLHLIRSL